MPRKPGSRPANKPLYVYLEDGAHEEIGRMAVDASGRRGRLVSISEYVRAALKYAALHQTAVVALLGRETP